MISRLIHLGRFALAVALSIGLSSGAALAQAEQAVSPRALISLGEAQAIIEGAIAFTEERGQFMAIVVVDHSGDVVASSRMDGAAFRSMDYALGKAFASAMQGRTTEELGALVTTRPDRYFGIINLYPGRVYLVGGGVPLTVDGILVGAVGVAGLPQGVDEMAARAGMEDWEEYRSTLED
jgi:uncharacterized protein GlcG (DUF336 family)